MLLHDNATFRNSTFSERRTFSKISNGNTSFLQFWFVTMRFACIWTHKKMMWRRTDTIRMTKWKMPHAWMFKQTGREFFKIGISKLVKRYEEFRNLFVNRVKKYIFCILKKKKFPKMIVVFNLRLNLTFFLIDPRIKNIVENFW